MKLKIWATVTAIFMAGIIVGATGMGWYIRYHFQPPKSHDAFRKEVAGRITDTLRKGVDLTDAEAVKVEAEVDASLIRLQKMHEEMQPRMDAITAEGIQKIRTLLTTEQQAKFDALLEESRSQEFNIFHLPPPPPPLR